MTIVGDLKQLQTAFFDQDIDLCGSCVDGVFNEFFECVRGTLDYFPRSDFVHDLRCQRVSCGIARETFLSRRFMGRAVRSMAAGRFVPRGELGASIDTRASW